MDIREAIKIAEEQESMQKEKLRNPSSVNRGDILKFTKKELLQKLQDKARKFLKDKNIREGIQFIEERSNFFTLDRDYKYAIYLSQNGSLKEQHWGMYMGNENIQKFDIHGHGCDTIYRILSLDLKEELIQQILNCKNKQDLFVELFDERHDEGGN